MAEWRFPSNDHGETKGINDSGVAQFRGAPLRSLAREICQNSLDAARKDTVTVEFNAFDIPSNQIPGYNELKDTFVRCSDFWGAQKAVTTKNFFSNAYDKICADKVSVLRISDFNTSGLTGSHAEINTHWINLTKSSGVSDKNSTSGGSFGIGKFAPFACSDFSTVFYSTYDEEEKEASQGVARLVTFARADGETTHGVGFYGEDRNTPTYEQLALEPGFSRGPGEYGTDIYIVGYKYASSNEEWEKSIIISILDSFLGAVWHEKLIVKVGEYCISKATLNDLIEMFREELTGYTDRYYEVLTSEKTKWYIDEDFLGLGSIKLGLMLGNQEMHRKVAMIRKTGMKIKDQDHISSFIPFAGIMFIDGKKINEQLRQLENPEHTEWQVARADNEIQARALLKSIRDFLCRKVEELASEGGQEDFEVVGLDLISPDDTDEHSTPGKEENVVNQTLTIEKHIPQKKKADTASANTGGTQGITYKDGGFTEGNSVLGYIHTEDTHPDHEHKITKDPYPVDTKPEGTQKIPQPHNVIPQKLRIMCMDKAAGKYVIMFVPNVDGSNGVIHIALSAESGNYDAPLISASLIGRGNLSVSGGDIKHVTFIKDMPVKLSIQLDYSDYCSMEVSAYAD